MTAAAFSPDDPHGWFEPLPNGIVECFNFDLTCPQCGDFLELKSTERLVESVRRAQLTCTECGAMWRLTVTLVRVWHE